MANRFPKHLLKSVLLFSFLLTSFFSQAQIKSFTVLDSITKNPIDLVHLFYPDLDVGSITNADGKIEIPLKKNRLLASHINYKNKTFLFDEFKEKDTIFLFPRYTELEEIVVFNTKLKDKIQQVLQAIEDNYMTDKVIHNTTYKEVYRINDSLSRLFQIQMDWWSNNGLYNFQKSISKQNRVAIDKVDYSKTIQFKEGSKIPNGGYIGNESFFRFSYLNYLLILIQNFADDIVLKSVQKEGDQINVVFDAVLKQNEKKLFEYQQSRIVFDSTYTKVKFLQLNMIYDGVFEKDFSTEKNIEYEKATTAHYVELSFEESQQQKMIPNYFISEVQGIIRFDDTESKISSKQSFFVTGSTFSKKLRGSKVLDLSKPFYMSLEDEKPKQQGKILLTKEEQSFLDKEE
jgi:hypothetical protein